MRYLLKECTIIDAPSSHHLQVQDVLIDNGCILKIGQEIEDEDAEIIRSEHLHCSIGWMDIGTHLGEPGYEQRETIVSLCEAAKHGGYTDVAVFAQAQPVITTKNQVKSIRDAANHEGINIHIIGPLSENMEGQNIAEYMDLNAAGVTAFSDGLKGVEDAGLLIRAMQYSKSIDATIIHHPVDEKLAHGGNIHEGDVSIRLGMKGSPSISESTVIHRDILLHDYADARLMLHCLSTNDAVTTLAEAKKSKNTIFSSVSYLNLLRQDTDLEDFDTNLKVTPPLRSMTDTKALLEGLVNGTIDCIVSNHVPLEAEMKEVEYPYATPGATGLETCFAAVNTAKSLPLEQLIEKLTYGPRRTMNIPVSSIEEGAQTPLTIFDPACEWKYTRSNARSQSTNNPFLGSTLHGKVILTIQ